MSDNGLDFQLPQRKETSKAPGWAKALVLGQAVILLLLLGIFLLKGAGKPATQAEGTLDRLQTLAQRLEKQGLAEEAAQAWENYLTAAQPALEEQAKIWYRIGVICQDGGLYEKALASFYRSDLLSKVPELEVEITRRSQLCLEAMGKAVAIRRNVEERTAVPGEAQAASVPMVEIGDWKLDRAGAEALLEKEIDRQLASSGMDDAQKMEQKKTALKNMEEAGRLEQFLAQFVSEELLYRAAREEKLQDTDAVREQLLRTQRSILADAYMSSRMKGISVSDSDIQDFYKANPAEFTVPASARIAHIVLPSEDRAKAALASLKGGEDFAAMAKLLSAEASTAEKGGEIAGWVDASSQIPWQADAAKAILADKTKPAKGEILDAIVKSTENGKDAWHLVKVLDRRAEFLKDIKDKDVFAEARSRLLDRKARETQGQVFQQLSQKYNVRWHRQ